MILAHGPLSCILEFQLVMALVASIAWIRSALLARKGRR